MACILEKSFYNASMKINGWINIDKPLGLSSARVVGRLKKLLHLTKRDKIGHGGTLDPMASGVLPIALGEATKTVSYVMDGRKSYDFSVTFGEEKDTGDQEGKTINLDPNYTPHSLLEVEKVLSKFLGEIEQIPHKYSAIKVDGKRAYDLARNGEDFELHSRKVTIFKLKCNGHTRNIFDFSVECSKGTYVRSLAIDIALKLNTYGYVSSLRRTRCANFLIKDAISLDFLEKSANNEGVERFLVPITDTLDDISGITLTEQEAVRIKHGQRIKIPAFYESKEILKVESNEKLIALVCADGDILHPVRVFND